MTTLRITWTNLLNGQDKGDMLAALPITIGRSIGNDLVLQDSRMGVSRRHAHLQFAHNHIVLTDLNSTNGIFIGAKRISQEVIDSQTHFTVGAYQIHVSAQVRCSQASCNRMVDSSMKMCPWCGRFLAEAETRTRAF